ncbi:MAG: hypothetical protein M3O36_19530 [Myxococcota bacterium]|nr:hypothetical protein [Myxococcota bacterium]
MTNAVSLRAAATWLWVGCACWVGCKPKASTAQCDALVERYASLVVKEKFPDASPAQVKSEQEREKSEARADDGLKNCSSEVSRAELECAMQAATPDALEKCLE